VFRLTLPRAVGGQLAGSPLPLCPDDADVAAADVAAVDSVAFPADRGEPGSAHG
jgi:hypothetical protein